MTYADNQASPVERPGNLSLTLAVELLKTATDRRKAKREVVKDKAGNQAVFLTLR